MKLSHTIPLGCGVALSLLLGGCATRLAEPATGYTCCNLRYDYGWTYSSNVQGGGAMVPAGSRAAVDTVKRGLYYYGTVGDSDVALGYDSAGGREASLQWLRRVIVPQDPKAELDGWSIEVQKAVYAGKVSRGMTRAQVAMSLSYPSPSDTQDLNAGAWRYWTSQDDDPVDVNFGADGTVVGFSGPPSAVRRLQFAP